MGSIKCEACFGLATSKLNGHFYVCDKDSCLVFAVASMGKGICKWERHDQHTDSADNYTDVLAHPVGVIDYQEEPYTPQVGEECEISNCGNPYIWCKIEYMGKDLCVVSHEIHKEQHYHLSSAKFRKLKTKRDICMDAIKEGLHQSVWEAQIGYYGFAVDKLIKADLIK